MIIELDDSVFEFADEAARRRLSAIVDYATAHGHRVLHVDGDPLPTGSHAHAVLEENPFSPLECDWLKALMAEGFQFAQKANASRRVVRVHAGKSDWNASPPLLSLEDARNYVVDPTLLLVENEQNDRRFLNAWVPASRAGDLKDSLARRALQFLHGGGITGITARIEAADEEGEVSFLHRATALFDSDAAEPNKPSSNAKVCRRTCRKHLGKPFHRFHMLERRSIENYLPLDLLDSYAKSKDGGHVHPDAVSTLRSLGTTSTHVRHYHMKNGLLVDFPAKSEKAKERRAAYKGNSLPWDPNDAVHLPVHWRTRSADEHAALLRGFSDSLAPWCLAKIAAGQTCTFDAAAEAEAEKAFATILDWV